VDELGGEGVVPAGVTVYKGPALGNKERLAVITNDAGDVMRWLQFNAGTVGMDDFEVAEDRHRVGAGRDISKVGQPTLEQVKRLRLDLNQARTEIEELRRQQAPAGGALGDVYDLLGKVSGCGGRRQRHASQYQHQ
jgi:hypothetical protein